jgi:hypothetical protein
MRLHILEKTLGCGKTFFIKYFTHPLQMQAKNVLLITTTRDTTLRLSQHACTTHTQFRIPLCGYPSTLS